MRLDRLLPLPTPVVQPGRKDGNPPRREPDTPERHGAAEPPPSETTQSAPLALKAAKARSVTSTGVCIAASGKTPAESALNWPDKLSASTV